MFIFVERLQLMDAPGVESQGELFCGLSRRCGCPASLHPFSVAFIGCKRELLGIVAPKVTCAFVYRLGRHFDDSFALATLTRGAVEFRCGIADDACHAMVVCFEPIIVTDGFTFGVKVGMGKGDAVTESEGTFHAHAFGSSEGAVVDNVFHHAVFERLYRQFFFGHPTHIERPACTVCRGGAISVQA